ncbi:hypothetical protein LTR16_011581, partial [Cryomyces antarcticus]
AVQESLPAQGLGAPGELDLRQRRLLRRRARRRTAPALHAKPVALRQALPGHEVRLLRRDDLPLLPADPEQREHADAPGRRLLQQGEDELGQQQPGVHPRLPAVAAARPRAAADGHQLRAEPEGGPAGRAGET